MASDETRQALIAYISSSACKLFSQVQGFFQVSHEHLDALIHAGAGLPNLLVRLHKLDAKAKKFISMPALIAAVEAAELKAVNKRRKSLLAFFVSPACALFSRVDTVRVSVEELDELLAVCQSSSSSASGALRAVLKLLKAVNEKGQRFDSVRALLPVLHVLHEKEEQGRRHDELSKQLAQQQQQLMALQAQLMQQQVMTSPPQQSQPFLPASPPPAASAFDSLPGSGGYSVESFLQQMQLQQLQQQFGSPLTASPPPSASPLYDYYSANHMMQQLGAETEGQLGLQQQLSLLSHPMYGLHQQQQSQPQASHYTLESLSQQVQQQQQQHAAEAAAHSQQPSQSSQHAASHHLHHRSF